VSAHAAGDASSKADLEPLWTVADVATYLRVSRSWVYHRAELGELPCLRIGALLRFDPDQIRAFARGERPTPAKILSLRSR
jgi:excisionase family DNA binding protein